MSPLPIWLLWAQALALPAIALAIAGIGAWLAWQQVQIAKIKLQHDLFERRFEVFKTANNLLVHALMENVPSIDAMQRFARGTAETVFIFDDAMDQYLRSISDRMTQMQTHYHQFEKATAEEERNIQGKRWMEDREWAQSQLAVLVDRFKPFLRLDQRK